MGPILGVVSGPVERVFNKTRSLYKSLYARARTGVMVGGQIWLKWTPDPTGTLNTANLRGTQTRGQITPTSHGGWYIMYIV